MYRLSSPNFLILLVLILAGVILTSATPNYFGATRILSFISLIIGELGMSFIPVIALYPKANPYQSVLLAFIFFISTFIMCVAAWGVNSFGWPGDYAFQWKDGEFYVNTYSLFVANIVSLASLVINFKLIYDEELTKEHHKTAKYSKKRDFKGFKKTLIRQPASDTRSSFSKSPSQSSFKSSPKVKDDDDDDFGRPFDFISDEPTIQADKLPEESSGKLFSQQVKEDLPEENDFFSDENIFKDAEQSSRQEDTEEDFPFFNEKPSNIDTGFKSSVSTKPEVKKPEQKITPKTESKIERPDPIKLDGSVNLPGDIKKDLAAIFEQYSSLNAVKKITSDISEKHKYSRERKLKKDYKKEEKINISINDDVHEASFRPLNAIEKMDDIKESLKKELEHEIKGELLESLKSELKRDLISSNEEEEEEQEDLDLLQEKLNTLNGNQKIVGSMFVNKAGGAILQEWKSGIQVSEDITSSICQAFKSLSKSLNRTNQGDLNNLLLETDNGILVLSQNEGKILAIQTEGTGEIFSGQILRTLSELEDEE